MYLAERGEESLFKHILAPTRRASESALTIQHRSYIGDETVFINVFFTALRSNSGRRSAWLGGKNAPLVRWADWGDWSECACSGLQERHRSVRTKDRSDRRRGRDQKSGVVPTAAPKTNEYSC